MGRLARMACLLGWMAGVPVSWAEPDPDCAGAAVSIYFAGGASQPTREASDVLARTGRELAQCRSETVSVVARFSPRAGGVSLQLALERLVQVATALEQAGVDINRVRVAALPYGSGTDASGPGRVDVWTRQPMAPTPRSAPSDQSEA